MDKISAVLINWKRPEELKQIESNLRLYPFIDDIVVVDNSVGVNKQVWGRYCGARHCKHDVVYTQDDDCIVENLEDIVKSFDGEHLSNGLKPEAIKSYAGKNHTLVGWGAVFKKDWVKIFDKYLAKYPEDEILYTNADRIFTALLGKPFNTTEAMVRDFPSATGEMAMASRPDITESTREALRRIETL